jgi:acetate kinase
MATRSGSVDPGMLLWLLEREEISPQEMNGALEHQSGLLALGGSADMREIVERAGAGDESDVGHRARLALDVYVHRLRGGIAAMAASLGGLDVLVFTGGVGERSAAVRERAVAGLAFLGVELDVARNAAVRGDAEIGAGGSGVSTLVITAREDLEIARQVRAVLRRN